MALSNFPVGPLKAVALNAVVTALNLVGSTRIIPTTSSSGVSVNAVTGLVTLTNAAAADLRNIFTSAYDNYELEYDLVFSAAVTNLFAQLTITGTVQSSLYSNQQTTFAGATTLSTAGSTFWNGLIGVPGAGLSGSGTMKVFGPAKAAACRFVLVGMVSTGATNSTGVASGQHTGTVSRDGFLLTPASGTFSGTLIFRGSNVGR